MTDNELVVRRFYELFNAGDVEGVELRAGAQLRHLPAAKRVEVGLAAHGSRARQRRCGMRPWDTRRRGTRVRVSTDRHERSLDHELELGENTATHAADLRRR